MRLFPPNPKRIYSVPTLVGDWIVQIKYDGHRAVIECFDGEFKVFGKAGQYPLAGEVIGPRQAGEPNNRLCVWDDAYLDNVNLTDVIYRDRQSGLIRRLNIDGQVGMEMCVVAAYKGMTLYASRSWSAAEWRQVQQELLARNRADEEGLVFKRADHCLCWHPRTNQETYDMLKLKWR